MEKIKEKILADARSRKERYADRMEVTELQADNLPEGLKLYTVRISQLFDYLPISYIVVGNEFFSSLQKGDFSRLLERLRFLEENRYTATDLITLFLLLEHPSRDHRLVEKPEDIALSQGASSQTRQKLAQLLSTTTIDKVKGGMECTFYCFNHRSRVLERFQLRIGPDYSINGETVEECFKA
jgi:hypothetical protein